MYERTGSGAWEEKQMEMKRMTWEFNEGFQINATFVANQFIDQYMVGASGEYVKVYLYLLRHAGENLSLGEIAGALHYTEGDVKRAVAYWEKEGVLTSGVRIGNGEESDGKERIEQGRGNLGKLENVKAKEEKREEVLVSLPEPAKPVYSKELLSRLSGDEDFTQLLYIAQKYMNKVFTQKECQIFAYLYGELHLSAELLEYLVEYCVQNGHSSFRYMETVALNWHQKGLLTVEEAKAYSAGFNKDSFAVMKAFGLNDRRPADTEKRFIETWFGAFGFSREIVLEACNRTIEATHTPSFAYANKILTEWKKAGVKNLSDVEDLDMIRQKQEKDKGETRKKKSKAVNHFHNFEQSSTSYDSLMMEKVRARMEK